MLLVDRIVSDLKTALKEKDQVKLLVLRGIKSAVKNAQIEGIKAEATDQLVLGVLQKEAKRRRESIEAFQAASRSDLVEKEKKELEILKAYLPEGLSEQEVRVIIEKAISELGASADMAKVMSKVMPQCKGRADGKMINGIVKELLHL